MNKISSTAGKILLILASVLFYVYGGLAGSLALLISVVGNFILAVIQKHCTEAGGKKAVLTVSILFNIALLFYYKYLSFVLSGVSKTFSTDLVSSEILIPLGISFFTFQQIMIQVSLYRKETEPGLIDYLLLVLYFPKLLMGPLAEPTFLLQQFNDPDLKKVRWDNISAGLKTFAFGLFKKMVLANTFSAAVAWGYAHIDKATSMDWFLVMLFYTFEIYFDFSGWIDMATGASLMLNITLPINFNSPFKAISFSDFWKRWHISLLKFFTKYIYIPLGGSRKGSVRTYLNILIVFLISGIWHGSNYTFILWGLFHGVICSVERMCKKRLENVFLVVRWAYTLIGCMLLRILYCSESVSQWITILKKMFTFQDMSVSKGLISSFVLPEQNLIFRMLHLETLNANVRGLGMVIFTVAAFIICLVPENNYNNLKKNNLFTMIIASLLFVWGFLCLSGESVFVYFNF